MKQITFLLFLMFYSSAYIQAQQLTRYKDSKNMYTYKDEKGAVVIETETDHSNYPKVHSIKGKNGKWGLIDASVYLKAPLLYDEIDLISGGLFRAFLNKKIGFLDSTGKVIIPFKYAKSDRDGFKYGIASVALNQKYGIIDKTGKVLIPLKYDYLTVLDSNLVVTINSQNVNDQKYGLINKAGKELLPMIYNGINDDKGTLLVFLNNKGGFTAGFKLGFINRQGKLITPVKYDTYQEFSEGLAAVQVNKQWGFIDETGKEVITPQYYRVSKFKNGYADVYEISGGPKTQLKKPIPITTN